jgi:hypothetical protein
VHSRYRRTLSDVPCTGLTLYLAFRIRRFFCQQSGCSRRIFTERLPTVVAPYARRTRRLSDWSYKRGQRYGTILCDLERHRIVDLLPDRTAESLAAWLRAHPGVEVISRDRSSLYAEGAREGAPEAVQVADRWHLMKNLTEALERILQRHHTELRQAHEQIATATACPPPTAAGQPAPTRDTPR